MSIAVIGAGAWGAALAQAWAGNGADVTLIARDDEAAARLGASRQTARLPGVTISKSITVSASPGAIAGHDVVAFVVPTQAFRTVAQTVAPHINSDTRIVLCAKGIDRESGQTVAEMAGTLFAPDQFFVLSGPSFAHDVARNRPTAVTLAGHDLAAVQGLAETLSTPNLRLYASDDIAGAEAGGALKNVLALAVGAARGLELGASAEAALIARGFAEMVRLGVAMGGRAATLAGLSGLGDLVLTCSSPQSRNFAYGTAMASGAALDGLPLAEGVHTARAALDLARSGGIDVPIIEAVVAVLEGATTVQDAVANLLARPLKTEA
jgi:glycerol-3-phosphate dehydrogenase (NAD(P)+)